MIKVTRRCLRALDMWKKPWFLSQGLVLGGSVSSRNANDGRLPHGLGSGHEWPLRSRSVGRSPSQLAHQLPGDAGSFSSVEAFSSRPRRPSCASSHRQYVGGLLHQPPGGSAFAPPVQAGTPDPSVGPGETALLEGSVHPWVPQSGSRHPVETGAEARGMDAPHRGDGADLEEVRSSPGGLVCVSRDLTMSPLVLSDSSSSTGAGCHGADVAEASSVRLPPDCSAPGSSGESSPGRGSSLVSSPVLAGPSMVCGPGSPSRRLSMGDSHLAGSPLTGSGHHSSPPPRVVEAMGVAPEGAQLIASGLSTEVVETILQSRAPSTRKSYTAKWHLFTSWCHSRQLDPVVCPLGSVLEFIARQICLRVILFHVECLRGRYCCSPRPCGWAVSREEPVSNTILLRGYQEAEASGTPKDAYLGFGCGSRGPF